MLSNLYLHYIRKCKEIEDRRKELSCPMAMLNILFLSVELKYIYEMIQTNEPKQFIYDIGRRCFGYYPNMAGALRLHIQES